MHLCDQRIEVVEPALLAQEGDEIDVQMLAIQVAVEIEHIEQEFVTDAAVSTVAR